MHSHERAGPLMPVPPLAHPLRGRGQLAVWGQRAACRRGRRRRLLMDGFAVSWRRGRRCRGGRPPVGQHCCRAAAPLCTWAGVRALDRGVCGGGDVCGPCTVPLAVGLGHSVVHCPSVAPSPAPLWAGVRVAPASWPEGPKDHAWPGRESHCSVLLVRCGADSAVHGLDAWRRRGALRGRASSGPERPGR